MTTLTAILTVLTLLIGLVISVAAVTARILNGIEDRTRKVLMDVGLIKFTPPDQRSTVMWPNGWENLPDSLRGLWEAQEALEAEVHAYGSPNG
jgi:hypothetical protein